MFQLRVVRSEYVEPLNVVAIDAELKGELHGTLVDRLFVDDANATCKYLVKTLMMIDGPRMRREKDVLYLALEVGDYDIEALTGQILVPLDNR